MALTLTIADSGQVGGLGASTFDWARMEPFTITSAASDGASEYASVAHGLGGAPDGMDIWARCATAEHGYVADERVKLSLAAPDNRSNQDTMYVHADATNLTFRFNNDNGDGMRLLRHKTTGELVSLTLSKWDFQIIAWRFNNP